MDDRRDVIVFLEAGGEKAEPINSGLLAEGGRIARLLGGSVSTIFAEPYPYPDEALARTVKAALEGISFRLLLFADTDQGRELAPMVAFEFGISAVIGCHDIRFNDGMLHYIKRIYNDQFEQAIIFRNCPEIATLSLELPKVRETDFPAPAREICFDLPVQKPEKRIVETIAPEFETVDIRYAKRILDIGYGCAQPELLEMARHLAHLLEASIGTTRPMVDEGHWPKSRMIGQTGKETEPELCITLGVSGSPHHAAGLRKSGKILSVNSDPRAPIWQVSNAGFVSDLGGVLPKLINLIQQFRDKGLT